MKTVLTYGTFDLLHIGHLNLLRRARELGDRLVVGLSTDEFNDEKGKTTVAPFEHRVQILQSIRYVDKVIAERSWEQKIADVQENDVSLFVMGDDWAGKFDFLQQYCDVVYLPRTKDISTSLIREAVVSHKNEQIVAIKNILENAANMISDL
jgi:glycerol-3-phosphate cytidylyltransferase